MSKKWMKVDPTTLKVGDEVRWVMKITGGRVIREVVVREVGPRSIRLGLAYIAPGNGTWFVRKPKKAKPPVRPDEPPVGSLFRINRTGNCYCRADGSKYVRTDGFIPWEWVEITEPGDTIQLLKLVAVDE